MLVVKGRGGLDQEEESKWRTSVGEARLKEKEVLESIDGAKCQNSLKLNLSLNNSTSNTTELLQDRFGRK